MFGKQKCLENKSVWKQKCLETKMFIMKKTFALTTQSFNEFKNFLTCFKNVGSKGNTYFSTVAPHKSFPCYTATIYQLALREKIGGN